MRKQIMALIAALAISIPASPIVAAPKSPKLSKCDGKKRRPANPYGSILPTVDPETGTSTPAGQPSGSEPDEEPKREGVEVFPSKSSMLPKPATRPGAKTQPIVPPISSAQPKRVYQSC
ncbi:hypothetical protein A8B75_06755 [Sphingomonadales bacterium EhC05]|uniref:hypothetical protein n=1 Tax=Parasphingorhabdus sp. TaxID=2709688 RepID=UPI0007F3CA93|nr:hypothetical protein A8B75_06755 [Sphingomonadales bacterium EhC05]